MRSKKGEQPREISASYSGLLESVNGAVDEDFLR